MAHISVAQHISRFLILWGIITFVMVLGYLFVIEELTVGVTLAVIGVVVGISGILWQYIKKMSDVAQLDSLTKLIHRTAFIDSLEKAITYSHRHGQTFHMIVMDINGFKRINDSLGHTIGDQFLASFARNLKDCVRSQDIVGRLGGDEFGVIIPDSEGNIDCVEIIKRIIGVANQPFFVDGRKIHGGVSIGMVTYPKDGTTTVNLLRCADIAMYSAKSMQKDFCIYSQEQDRYKLSDLELMGELKVAIELDQLELWFQPKQCIKTGTISGVESLVRWRHPSKGMIPPDKFIPMAEESGIIRYLTHLVIAKATKCYKTLSLLGYDLEISINVSPNDLVDSAVMTEVIQNIVKNDMPPNRLILEVTETAIMHDPDAAFKVLVGLESLGIKISLDDFGTGHSSLVYLKNFPIQEIKLDKSFIINLVSGSQTYHIVKSTIDLAHRIHASIVAEGVEEESAVKVLKELECDYLQGYYIAKPMPLTDLIDWLKLHQPLQSGD